MIYVESPPEPRATIDLNQAIQEHGAWRVLLAALSALTRSRRDRPPAIAGLTGHLRRDIGLPDPPNERTHQPFRF